MTNFNIRNELAIFHINNAIGDVEDAIVVGNEKDCAAFLFGEGLHEFHNFATRFFVKGSRGFIG